MHIERFVCGRARSNAYVMHDDAGAAVLVDAGTGSADQVMGYVGAHDLVPHGLVITHGHPDHIFNARRIADRYGIGVHIHRDDLAWFTDPATGQHVPFVRAYGRAFGRYHKVRPHRLHVVDDGARIVVGPFAVDVLHTPGHSMGSACLRVGDDMFCGDTVFRGNVGRVYLGGDKVALRGSIRAKLLPLPDDLRLFPGHGGDTLVGEERALWERYVNPEGG